MAALPAANLLDDYLHSTLIGRQCTEQTVSDSPVPAQTTFLHSQVLQGVHQALDSALAGQGATSLGSPTSWRQLSHPQGTTAAGAAWSPVGTAPAPAQARAAASTDSNRPAVTNKGIFRAMRQADASAFYAQQLAAERSGPGQVSRQQHMQQVDQEPTFPAADASTAEVRLLADHAAFSSKLQRMQQDMEVRSYRQSLLHKLQQPSALFNQSQEQSSAQQQQQAGSATRCSSAVMWQLGDRMMPQPEPRPCTAPKPSVRQQAAASSRPTAAAVNAPQSSLSRQASWSHLQQQQQGQSAMQPAAAGCNAGAGCLLASTAPSQLQHLKHLADLELPWKPPAAAQGSAGAFAGSYRPAQQQSRPASPCGSSRSGGSSAAGHRLFLQSQQQQQSVQRAASAVAALQQSLGELARLKAKYGQQQQRREEEQQQQLRAQQEQRWQEEQQKKRQEQQTRDLRRDNWLQATAAGQHQTHTLHAAAAGAADTWVRQGAGYATRAYKWAEQDTAQCNPGLDLGLNRQNLQRSGSSASIGAPGYSRWDAWQQQVHSDRQQQLPQQQPAHRGLGGALDSLLSEQSVLRQQQAAQESLRRSKSAPRLHRAWDVPLESRLHDIREQQQRVSARVALFGQGRRSSSPGDRVTTRGLGSSWENSTWQLPRQQQQRPKTAGACVSSGAGFDRSKPTAGLSSSAATAAGWLNSSPVKRANRLAAAQGAGVATTAGGRYQAPAAAAGNAATMHSQLGGLNRTGAGVGSGGGSSSWLAAGAGTSGGRWGEQLQGTAAGASLPSRLRTAAAVTGVLATGGAPQRSWLPQSSAPQAPVGACKAALLASRAAGAGGAVGGAAAATNSAAARRQELVQRALNGYKPHQVTRTSATHDDASSVASEDSRPSSWAPATGGGAGRRRESAYAAALARVHAAKQGAPVGGARRQAAARRSRADDCSSSSSTSDAEGDSSSCV